MPPPSTVVCEICGGKFSKHSLLIHQKQCATKRELSTAFCPSCDQIVSNDEYSKHVTACKAVNERGLREKRLAAEKAKKAAKAGGVGAGGGGGGAGPAGAAPLAPPPAVTAAVAAPQRSKIPEAVLRRLEAAKSGAVELTPEQKLHARLGKGCDACPGARAIIACLGCHMVYCKACCAAVHDGNAALADHTPVLKADLDIAEGLANEAAAAASRVACSMCDRRFDATRIAKHQVVCASQSTKVVKVKAATDLRVKGTEFEKFLKKTKGQAKSIAEMNAEKAAAFVHVAPAAQTKWRRELEAAQKAEAASGGGGGGATAISHAAPAPAPTPAPVIMPATPDAAAITPPADNSASSAPDVPAPAPAPPKKPALRIGDKVEVIDKKVVGTLQFKGPIWGMAKGTWFGIEFHDAPHGDCDGAFNSVHYFYCPDKHGRFVRPDGVRRVDDPAAPPPTTTAPPPQAAAPSSAPAPRPLVATTPAPAPAPAASASVDQVNTALPTNSTSRPQQVIGGGAVTPSVMPVAPSMTAPLPTPAPASTPMPVPTRATGGPPLAPGGSSLRTPSSSSVQMLGVPQPPPATASRSQSPSVSRPTTTAGGLDAAAAANPWLKKLAAKTGGVSATPAATSSAAATQKTAPLTPTRGGAPGAGTKIMSLAAAKAAPAPVATEALSKRPPGASAGTTPAVSPEAKPALVSASVGVTGGAQQQQQQQQNIAPTAGGSPGDDSTSAPVFSGALASKLRAKVVAERGGSSNSHTSSSSASAAVAPRGDVLAAAKAKRALAEASKAAAPLIPAASIPRAPAVSLSDAQEAARQADIAKSVDFLRVLAGDKAKLGAGSGAGTHVAFGGMGNKLGGGSSDGPSKDLYRSTGPAKKIVSADGKIGIARGATDAAEERERRAAAALARFAAAAPPATS